jgi:hypothetical protein
MTNPEPSEERDDDDSAIAELMAELTVILAAEAILFRDSGRGGSFAEEVALTHVGPIYHDAHVLGQSEQVADTKSGAAVAAAQRRVYGEGGILDRLRGWQADITPTLTDDQLLGGARRFEGGAWGSYQEGRAVGAKAANIEADVYGIWERDNIKTSCAGCKALDGKAWPVDEIPFWPGDGATECRANCRCAIRLDVREEAA